MSSGALNLFIFGILNNAPGGSAACVIGDDLPGICTPLHECRPVLRDIARLRSPVYCEKAQYSLVPFVCCPTTHRNYPRPTDTSTWNPDSNSPAPTTPDYNNENVYPTEQPTPPESIPLPSTIMPPVTENSHSPITDPDAIVFHRLAERKCMEYSELIYENRSIYEPETSTTTIERVNTCLSKIGPAVVGGQKADAAEYPHMALIGYKSITPDGDEETQWLCGGAIISMRFILTAAHCIRTSRGSPTQVRIGDLNLKSSTEEAAPQTIPVINSIPHEQYRPPYVYNDIGLLELAHNIEVTQFARPACLYLDSSVLPTVPLIATGWGRTDFDGPSSADLLEVTLEQFSTGECGQTYKASKQLPGGVNGDSQLCAGSKYEKKDTCKGDSGGPLQVKQEHMDCMYSVVGVTSFGRGCGNIGVPGVYTRVSHFADWIEERAFINE